MNYSEFVSEVVRLLSEGRSLFGRNETHQDPSFRKWRHRLTVLINAIKDRSYSVECDVESRLFDIASFGDISKSDRIKRYNQELQDTLNELETIVEHFSKYGDPKPASATGSEREEWLGLSRGAITNQNADPNAREAANDFLHAQTERAT